MRSVSIVIPNRCPCGNYCYPLYHNSIESDKYDYPLIISERDFCLLALCEKHRKIEEISYPVYDSKGSVAKFLVMVVEVPLCRNHSEGFYVQQESSDKEVKCTICGNQAQGTEFLALCTDGTTSFKFRNQASFKVAISQFSQRKLEVDLSDVNMKFADKVKIVHSLLGLLLSKEKERSEKQPKLLERKKEGNSRHKNNPENKDSPRQKFVRAFSSFVRTVYTLLLQNLFDTHPGLSFDEKSIRCCNSHDRQSCGVPYPELDSKTGLSFSQAVFPPKDPYTVILEHALYANKKQPDVEFCRLVGYVLNQCYLALVRSEQPDEREFFGNFEEGDVLMKFVMHLDHELAFEVVRSSKLYGFLEVRKILEPIRLYIEDEILKYFGVNATRLGLGESAQDGLKTWKKKFPYIDILSDRACEGLFLGVEDEHCIRRKPLNEKQLNEKLALLLKECPTKVKKEIDDLRKKFTIPPEYGDMNSLETYLMFREVPESCGYFEYVAMGKQCDYRITFPLGEIEGDKAKGVLQKVLGKDVSSHELLEILKEYAKDWRLVIPYANNLTALVGNVLTDEVIRKHIAAIAREYKGNASLNRKEELYKAMVARAQEEQNSRLRTYTFPALQGGGVIVDKGVQAWKRDCSQSIQGGESVEFLKVKRLAKYLRELSLKGLDTLVTEEMRANAERVLDIQLQIRLDDDQKRKIYLGDPPKLDLSQKERPADPELPTEYSHWVKLYVDFKKKYSNARPLSNKELERLYSDVLFEDNIRKDVRDDIDDDSLVNAFELKIKSTLLYISDLRRGDFRDEELQKRARVSNESKRGWDLKFMRCKEQIELKDSLKELEDGASEIYDSFEGERNAFEEDDDPQKQAIPAANCHPLLWAHKDCEAHKEESFRSDIMACALKEIIAQGEKVKAWQIEEDKRKKRIKLHDWYNSDDYSEWQSFLKIALNWWLQWVPSAHSFLDFVDYVVDKPNGDVVSVLRDGVIRALTGSDSVIEPLAPLYTNLRELADTTTREDVSTFLITLSTLVRQDKEKAGDIKDFFFDSVSEVGVETAKNLMEIWKERGEKVATSVRERLVVLLNDQESRLNKDQKSQPSTEWKTDEEAYVEFTGALRERDKELLTNACCNQSIFKMIAAGCDTHHLGDYYDYFLQKLQQEKPPPKYFNEHLRKANDDGMICSDTLEGITKFIKDILIDEPQLPGKFKVTPYVILEKVFTIAVLDDNCAVIPCYYKDISDLVVPLLKNLIHQVSGSTSFDGIVKCVGEITVMVKCNVQGVCKCFKIKCPNCEEEAREEIGECTCPKLCVCNERVMELTYKERPRYDKKDKNSTSEDGFMLKNLWKMVRKVLKLDRISMECSDEGKLVTYDGRDNAIIAVNTGIREWIQVLELRASEYQEEGGDEVQPFEEILPRDLCKSLPSDYLCRIVCRRYPKPFKLQHRVLKYLNNLGYASSNFLIQAPTGWGKTLIYLILILIYLLGHSEGNVVIVTPSEPLAKQVIDDLKGLLLPEDDDDYDDRERELFEELLPKDDDGDDDREGLQLPEDDDGYDEREFFEKGRKLLERIRLIYPEFRRGDVEFAVIKPDSGQKSAGIEKFLSYCKFLVVDECDEFTRFLNAKFMSKLLEKIPPDRQTVVCSATMSQRQILTFTDNLLPLSVNTEKYFTSNQNRQTNVDHFVVKKAGDVKTSILRFLQHRLLNIGIYSIVFTQTAVEARDMAAFLRSKGVHCTTDIKEYKDLQAQVLVLSIYEGRGFDVKETRFTIFTSVHQMHPYIHASGRAGRKGLRGTSVIFEAPAWLLLKLQSVGILVEEVQDALEVADRLNEELTGDLRRVTQGQANLLGYSPDGEEAWKGQFAERGNTADGNRGAFQTLVRRKVQISQDVRGKFNTWTLQVTAPSGEVHYLSAKYTKERGYYCDIDKSSFPTFKGFADRFLRDYDNKNYLPPPSPKPSKPQGGGLRPDGLRPGGLRPGGRLVVEVCLRRLFGDKCEGKCSRWHPADRRLSKWSIPRKEEKRRGEVCPSYPEECKERGCCGRCHPPTDEKTVRSFKKFVAEKRQTASAPAEGRRQTASAPAEGKRQTGWNLAEGQNRLPGGKEQALGRAEKKAWCVVPKVTDAEEGKQDKEAGAVLHLPEVICRDYVQGCCDNPNCGYYHVTPGGVCAAFVYGVCKRAECRHPPPPSQQQAASGNRNRRAEKPPTPPPTPKKKEKVADRSAICKRYLVGICRSRDENCKYYHVIDGICAASVRGVCNRGAKCEHPHVNPEGGGRRDLPRGHPEDREDGGTQEEAGVGDEDAELFLDLVDSVKYLQQAALEGSTEWVEKYLESTRDTVKDIRYNTCEGDAVINLLESLEDLLDEGEYGKVYEEWKELVRSGAERAYRRYLWEDRLGVVMPDLGKLEVKELWNLLVSRASLRTLRYCTWRIWWYNEEDFYKDVESRKERDSYNTPVNLDGAFDLLSEWSEQSKGIPLQDFLDLLKWLTIELYMSEEEHVKRRIGAEMEKYGKARHDWDTEWI